MQRNVKVNATLQFDGDILNPTGEETVVVMHSGLSKPGYADFNLNYAALNPGNRIGQELQIQRHPNADPSNLSFPIIVTTLPIGQIQPPTFVSADAGLGKPCLIFPALTIVDANADGIQDVISLDESVIKYQALGTNVPVPAVAVLRWTGSYWLVIATSPGVVIDNEPIHA
ncbi:hypothetical protein HOU02_gp550 [Caulobacter phage CcrBL9]|uniref:Uncharacterized protein n=1 Tax=Caulobacter phage CcrBL9 TaxID=2283270 RepID=A0A385EDT4_9CAUD|nr:hypothetical protein HOU02_gp550 [Caulobacter phage CcrBL9]AXQ69175.1 hypothetical protein CcrBL9_gp151c [Caulobacter phage CcrBL9]